MIYVTFNDYPGGIYYSQVIDVIYYLNQISSKKVKLVAFISFRNFFENRKKIKCRYSDSIVVPMFPGVRNWKWNRLWLIVLSLIFFRSIVICRGIFAFHIIYPLRQLKWIQKIILDARGLYKAEFEEYRVINDDKIILQVNELEKKALQSADFKIAVSSALVQQWKEVYGIQKSNYVIIPCTLSNEFIKPLPDKEIISNIRKKLKYSDEDIVIVFSGSASGWQSLKISDEIFSFLLKNNSRIRLLFLGHHSMNEYSAFHQFPERIQQYVCHPEEVLQYLWAADYGWLVREQSVTNKVASPVKFAEYLVAGLKVIISNQLGDYSDFCKTHRCGVVVNTDESILSKMESLLQQMERVDYEEKKHLHQLAMRYFIKDKYRAEYQKLIS
ncbi:MAG: hypothetical protein AB1304_04395 [Bacteroidota bacterium]